MKVRKRIQNKLKKKIKKKKNKGKFKLTSDEQKEYRDWIEENPFKDDVSEEKWFTEQKPKKKCQFLIQRHWTTMGGRPF